MSGAEAGIKAPNVGMGVGAIVIALASIVIGEVLFVKVNHFARKRLSIVVGSILYRCIIALVLQLGLSTDYLRLLTAIVVTIALSVPIIKSKVYIRKEVR